ncbi:MAG: aminomethyl-transferring glycine dehydrogenase subunit GcvPA [Candidatus Kariarchaeaceae archaeon]|jgi:glycine dehydrogenase subunit 1
MSSFYESYIGTSEEERKAMLEEIGMNDILDLFSDIPEDLILDSPLPIPGPFSEQNLTRLFASIAAKSLDTSKVTSFLGGGIRQMYIPAAIEELMRRGELYTSYTPYQPEISQGLLQILYEYQSMLAEILAMDVVNASMYDWASALGEVVLVMARITRKQKVILAGPIGPNRLDVARAYVEASGHELILMPGDGNVPMAELIDIFKAEGSKDKKEREYAGVYFEVPTYFGTLPDYPQQLVEAVHEVGGLVAVGVDPISLGVIAPPGDYDADFVIGEGQLLGNAPSSGGPLLGIMATKFDRKWIRQIPGRLIGATTELNSELPGYCITLQTREQHIRREKATSNICTNESITAVNAAIYMAALGKHGLVELSQSLTDRAHYLAAELNTIQGVTAPLYGPIYSEFVIRFEGVDHQALEDKCISAGFVPGVKVDGEGCLRLLAVTDLHSKDDLDGFVQTIKEVMS